MPTWPPWCGAAAPEDMLSSLPPQSDRGRDSGSRPAVGQRRQNDLPTQATTMTLLRSLAAGFAGALALTALHETVRRLRPQDAPRMDVLGERGLRKLLRLEDLPQPDHETIYSATMLGDVLTNGLYYSLVGSGRHSLRRG
ncbi:MAG: hypothetical protein WKG07_38440 [Hymenobacter sp.]